LNRFSFPKKIGTSDSIVLVVGVCLSNHAPIDGLPQLARQSLVWQCGTPGHRHCAAAVYWGAGTGQWGTNIGACRTRPPARPPLHPTSWVTTMRRRSNRFESFFWCESNRIQ